jgi:hypothetical protein
MPVGIIDYGVPIVDRPTGTDRYVTLPGIGKKLIFDPGERRALGEPPVGREWAISEPRIGGQPESMEFTGVKGRGPRAKNDVVERGDNFIDIGNGYHFPDDVQLVMQFIEARIANRKGG